MVAEPDEVMGTVGGDLGTNFEGVLRHLWRDRDGRLGTPELLSLRGLWQLECFGLSLGWGQKRNTQVTIDP